MLQYHQHPANELERQGFWLTRVVDAVVAAVEAPHLGMMVRELAEMSLDAVVEMAAVLEDHFQIVIGSIG